MRVPRCGCTYTSTSGTKTRKSPFEARRSTERNSGRPDLRRRSGTGFRNLAPTRTQRPRCRYSTASSGEAWHGRQTNGRPMRRTITITAHQDATTRLPPFESPTGRFKIEKTPSPSASPVPRPQRAAETCGVWLRSVWLRNARQRAANFETDATTPTRCDEIAVLLAAEHGDSFHLAFRRTRDDAFPS